MDVWLLSAMSAAVVFLCLWIVQRNPQSFLQVGLQGSKGFPGFSSIPSCQLQSLDGIQTGDTLVLRNFSNATIPFQVGHGPLGPLQQAQISSTIQPKGASVQTKTPNDGVVSFQFGDCP